MTVLTKPEIHYPSSDGQPIAENTLQFKWIHALHLGFDLLFQHRPDVFIASDLLWYPVEGDPKTTRAPDLMIAFDRPKGERLSYRQWEEDDVAPQIALEVLSPSNRGEELKRKHAFYQTYGVEEYYVYDPDTDELRIWIRVDDVLTPVRDVLKFVSPRLGIRFHFPEGKPMQIIGPDGMPFQNHRELQAEAVKAKTEGREQYQRAQYEAERANAEFARAEHLLAMLRQAGIEPPPELSQRPVEPQ